MVCCLVEWGPWEHLGGFKCGSSPLVSLKHGPLPLRGHSLEGTCLGSPTWGLRVRGLVKVLSAPRGSSTEDALCSGHPLWAAACSKVQGRVLVPLQWNRHRQCQSLKLASDPSG